MEDMFQQKQSKSQQNQPSMDAHTPMEEASIGVNPFSELIRRNVTFRRIADREDPALKSFVDVYQKAFAGAPYFENFGADFVREKVWAAHEGKLLLVAEEKGNVIGLLCAHLLSDSDVSPSACSFIKEQIGPVINERGTLYFSELAVAPGHQKLGIGSALVAGALSWASEKLIPKFILRTAAEGSNSAGIFKKFGAQELSMAQEVVGAEAGGPESSSTKRLYLAGDVAWHGRYLARLKNQVHASIVDVDADLCHA